jgi:hypothetical protein
MMCSYLLIEWLIELMEWLIEIGKDSDCCAALHDEDDEAGRNFAATPTNRTAMPRLSQEQLPPLLYAPLLYSELDADSSARPPLVLTASES